MQDIPKTLLDWSESVPPTGDHVLKDDVPDDIKVTALNFEREFYKNTSILINRHIAGGFLVPKSQFIMLKKLDKRRVLAYNVSYNIMHSERKSRK